MANHKTAYYSGARAARRGRHHRRRAREEQIEALRAFGMAAGLAFQIQDDVLNLVGTKESTKKDFRSDITEGKRTLVAIHALRHSSDAAALLEEIFGMHTTDPTLLAEAVGIMEGAGSIDFAREYARDLILAAKRELVDAVPKSERETSSCPWRTSSSSGASRPPNGPAAATSGNARPGRHALVRRPRRA